MYTKFFLSDEAFNNLKERAVSEKYIRIKDRALGLGRFIDALSLLEYQDNRPQYLKDWRPRGLNIWFIPEYAGSSKLRALNVSEDSFFGFMDIARKFKIVRVTYFISEEKPILMVKNNQTPQMYTSAILEAIGTDLLTSIQDVPKPIYAGKPRTKKKEFYW